MLRAIERGATVVGLFSVASQRNVFVGNKAGSRRISVALNQIALPPIGWQLTRYGEQISFLKWNLFLASTFVVEQRNRFCYIRFFKQAKKKKEKLINYQVILNQIKKKSL